MSITAEIDKEADALYIRFSEEAVARTEELSESCFIDRDENGEVVGIEVLGPNPVG